MPINWKFSLLAEVEALLQKSQTEAGESFRDLDIPTELQRRQERLEKIAQVKAEIEARAQTRYEREKAEYEAKLRERAAKEKTRGRKLGGKKPQAPKAGPKAKDQVTLARSLAPIGGAGSLVNFTDGESRIMPVSGGGFEQAYNAHAGRGSGHNADCGQPYQSKPQRQAGS